MLSTEELVIERVQKAMADYPDDQQAIADLLYNEHEYPNVPLVDHDVERANAIIATLDLHYPALPA